MRQRPERPCSSVRPRVLVSVAILAVITFALASSFRTSAQAAPVVVVETSKGTFSFETFPNEAPRTVAHIVALVKGGFYDGQRIHRALPGFIVQFGDPQTRDLSKRAVWGRGAAAASGTPIGASEISPKHRNTKGAVGMAHLGEPAKADSQIYITLAARKDLDERYAVFGQLIDGDDVVSSLQVGDQITRVTVKP